MLALILLWLIFAVVVGFVGKDKRIGFGGAFAVALLLSPIIGIIVALVSAPAGPGGGTGELRYNQLVSKAADHIKRGEDQQAIDAIQEAMTHHPGNAAAYYNLACMYSKRERKDEAFYNLATAVSKGFAKIDRLGTDPDLAWLRTTDGWPAFVGRGYKLPS